MILVNALLICCAFVDSAYIKYDFKKNNLVFGYDSDKCFDCDIDNVFCNKKVIFRRITYSMIIQSLDDFCLCFLKNIKKHMCGYVYF